MAKGSIKLLTVYRQIQARIADLKDEIRFLRGVLKV